MSNTEHAAASLQSQPHWCPQGDGVPVPGPETRASRPRRSSTAVCGECGQPISLVQYEAHDSEWHRKTYRVYAHDWNGSVDSPEPEYHTAWAREFNPGPHIRSIKALHKITHLEASR